MEEEYKTQMQLALECYFIRLERNENPNGYFDDGGGWYPNLEERCDCYFGKITPSKAYPYSLLIHCRTAIHISQLFEVDLRLMRSHIKQYQLLQMEVESMEMEK